MKRIFSILAIALVLLVNLSFSQPAIAATSAGEKIFNNNCASCHAGGNNSVVAAKNLKTAALEKYGKNTIEAITLQVSKGKNAMPAFSQRLSPEQINLVANYVLEQASKDWAKG